MRSISTLSLTPDAPWDSTTDGNDYLQAREDRRCSRVTFFVP